MKKTGIALIVMASSVMASSVMAAPLPEGSALLQWAGLVPISTSQASGYWIIQDGGTAFTDGTLQFTNLNGVVSFAGSGNIGFKVVEDKIVDLKPYDSKEDTTQLSYNYELSSLNVGIDNIPQLASNIALFGVHANNSDTALVTGTPALATEGTMLRIKAGNSTLLPDDLVPGSNVIMQALISITPNGI